MIWFGVGRAGGAHAVIVCAAEGVTDDATAGASVWTAAFVVLTWLADLDGFAACSTTSTGSADTLGDVTTDSSAAEAVSEALSEWVLVELSNVPVVDCALTVVEGLVASLDVLDVLVLLDVLDDAAVGSLASVVGLVAAVLVDPVDVSDPADGVDCIPVEFGSLAPELALLLELELLLAGPSVDPESADATAAPLTIAAPTPRVMAPALNHIRAPPPRRLPPLRSTRSSSVILSPCWSMSMKWCRVALTWCAVRR